MIKGGVCVDSSLAVEYRFIENNITSGLFKYTKDSIGSFNGELGPNM